MRPRLAALWLVPVALAADQLSKHAVRRALALGDPVEVLGSVFRLTFIYNRGAAFGVDLGSPLLHTVMALAALGFVGWLYWSLPERAGLLRVALALVLGGALGNIVDRLRFGQVVDFFDVGLGEAWRWPVFNVADSCVTVGVILLAIGYRRHEAPAAGQEPCG
ncbi:MAG: signal peptidase II [Gemmatimonadota bacterium]